MRLFESPYTIKSENYKYLDSEEFDVVTIYYDHMTDLFAIVNPEKNCLVDFGIATEVKYVEIFAYKSCETSKRRDIYFLPDSPSEERVSLVKPNLESKAPDVVELSRDQARNLLERKYGSHFITVANGEFKIEEWQAVKKVEHAVCFAINPLDYGFSQDQAKEINDPGGLVSYVQKGKTLPSMDLVRTFQNALKNFCEDRNQSNRNDESTFRGEPSITFCNEKTR